MGLMDLRRGVFLAGFGFERPAADEEQFPGVLAAALRLAPDHGVFDLDPLDPGVLEAFLEKAVYGPSSGKAWSR